MKLKSRLAREWIKENSNNIGYGKGIIVNKDNDAVQDAAKQGFLAGFEKAREMAFHAFIHGYSIGREKGGESEARMNALEYAKDVGEEEVKE